MAANPKIAITDLSHLPRFGVKGREAAAWLQAQRIALPTAANRWVLHDHSSLVLRLGNSEYLVEDAPQTQTTRLLHASIKQRPAGVYPVARADAAFMLAGVAVNELMSEICMLDLRPLHNTPMLYMTQVADISATVIQQHVNGQATLRLWCDGSYHADMLASLNAVANDIDHSRLI